MIVMRAENQSLHHGESPYQFLHLRNRRGDVIILDQPVEKPLRGGQCTKETAEEKNRLFQPLSEETWGAIVAFSTNFRLWMKKMIRCCCCQNIASSSCSWC